MPIQTSSPEYWNDYKSGRTEYKVVDRELIVLVNQINFEEESGKLSKQQIENILIEAQTYLKSQPTINYGILTAMISQLA